MTNREAIQRLKNLINSVPSHIIIEALGKGIEALEFMDREWDRGILENWYIDSVSADDDPVWTKEHIDELCNDFHLIPKKVDEMGKEGTGKRIYDDFMKSFKRL